MPREAFLAPPPRATGDDPAVMLNWLWDMYQRLQNEVVEPINRLGAIEELEGEADLAAIQAKLNEIIRALRGE